MRGTTKFWESDACPDGRSARGRVNPRPSVNAVRLYSVIMEMYDGSGVRQCELVRATGWDRNTLFAALASAEYNGLLLSEDEHGRLYPYEEGR
jgi:hypothetical protein